MAMLTPATVNALLAEHGLRPKKSLGQNFLVDPNTARRIVARAELEPGTPVLEIGPGLGSLTLALVEQGHEVVALELDSRPTTSPFPWSCGSWRTPRGSSASS